MAAEGDAQIRRDEIFGHFAVQRTGGNMVDPGLTVKPTLKSFLSADVERLSSGDAGPWMRSVRSRGRIDLIRTATIDC